VPVALSHIDVIRMETRLRDVVIFLEQQYTTELLECGAAPEPDILRNFKAARIALAGKFLRDWQRVRGRVSDADVQGSIDTVYELVGQRGAQGKLW
jgi:hypothetical protein